MWNRVYNNRNVVYALLLVFILAPLFFKDIETTQFHGDESWWTHCGAEYFNLFFLERDFDNNKWHSYMGMDQPQIGRYFIGISLWGTGGIPLLEKAYKQPIYNFAESKQWNEDHGTVTPMEILLPVRLMMAAFGLCGCLLIYYIGSRAFSPEVGFLSGLLLGFNPLLLLYSRRAMTDAPLFFFMTAVVALLPALLHCYRWNRRAALYGICCLVGILSGVAAGVKLNGGIIGLIFASWMVLLAWEVFLDGTGHGVKRNHPQNVDQNAASNTDELLRKTCSAYSNKGDKTGQLFNILVMALLAGTTAVSTFYIASPNMYGAPISGALKMLDHRMRVVSDQQDNSSGRAIRTFPEKIKQTYTRLFNPSSNYSAVKFPKKIPVELFFFTIGCIGLCISEYQYVRDNRHFSFRAYVGLWVLLLFSGIITWIPLDWGRYYLPMFPAQVIMVAFGVTTSCSWLCHVIGRSNSAITDCSAG